ncbi:hypothetical protein IFM89_008774 [Coptis chinensis]|uniref:NADH:ubiquinone reductase (non-electrogenic) n=1 Tax=Coptis chinensis TaxID=261450 RepID=A0A835GVW7_9MAGN|nr:hypothetical protein IFM89_008774 [Coptis chinensis]
MGGFSFFSRLHDSSNITKLLVVFTLSSGGIISYSESQSGHGVRTLEPSLRDVKKKKVLVLGTGWAGISLLKDMDISSYDVQVVSPRNYFAFTPLLPSVTCGTVEARSIVEPVRKIIKKKSGEVQFLEAECVKIDAANKKVLCRHNDDLLQGKGEFLLDYDYLVIAVGAQVNTFNTAGVMEHCHFLKEVEDAQKIRNSVIDCFERSALPNISEEERRRNLHFVIVGGGPTGVEFAAELHDFVQEDVVKLYPKVQDLTKITVVQSGDHILNMFDERISSFAEQKFERDGIEVKTGCRVISVSDKAIDMKLKSKGEVSSVPYGMVVWSTGTVTRPVVRDFMEQIGQEDISKIFSVADKDNSGTLNVKEFQDVIEDILVRYPQVGLYLKSNHLHSVTDLLKDPQGHESKEIDIEGFKLALSHVDSQMKSLPATAQVAAQQGAYLARCFNHREDCKLNPEGPIRFGESGRHQFRPFEYKHFGQFAPLGGEQAAAELPGDWVSTGHSTQWLWYSVYASKQVSWRTRMLVVSDWTRRFIFGRDSSRI